MIALVGEPLDPAALRQNLEDESCGGVCIFEGRIRNHNQGRPVSALNYECYEAMALKTMDTLVQAARQRWGLGPVVLVHRVGEVALGDVAVWIGVASAHRSEAFAACRFLIDEVKATVAIWKKETYADGTSDWVTCHHHHGIPNAPAAAQTGTGDAAVIRAPRSDGFSG